MAKMVVIIKRRQGMKDSKDRVDKIKYSKPEVLAKNAPEGGYAAGCPSNNSYQCQTCFRQ